MPCMLFLLKKYNFCRIVCAQMNQTLPSLENKYILPTHTMFYSENKHIKREYSRCWSISISETSLPSLVPSLTSDRQTCSSKVIYMAMTFGLSRHLCPLVLTKICWFLPLSMPPPHCFPVHILEIEQVIRKWRVGKSGNNY